MCDPLGASDPQFGWVMKCLNGTERKNGDRRDQCGSRIPPRDRRAIDEVSRALRHRW